MHPLEIFQDNLNEMRGGDLEFFFSNIANLNSENFLKKKKNIEQIFGKKFPESYWNSFSIMNGENLSSVYFSSIDNLLEDNRDFVSKYGTSDLSYVILGHDVSSFYYLNLENDQFGIIDIDEIVYGEMGTDISPDYEEFLFIALESYL